MKRMYVSLCCNEDDEIVAFSIITDGEDAETFYFERSDVEYNMSAENFKKLVLISSDTSVLYKDGRNNLTYMKDTTEAINSYIKDIINRCYENEEIKVIGTFDEFKFVNFWKLINDEKILKYHNSFKNLAEVMNDVKLLKVYDKHMENTDNIGIVAENKINKLFYGFIL